MAGTRLVACIEVPVSGTWVFDWATRSSGFVARHMNFNKVGEIERKSWDMTWNVAIETGGWLASENVVLDIEAQAILQEG